MKRKKAAEEAEEEKCKKEEKEEENRKKAAKEAEEEKKEKKQKRLNRKQLIQSSEWDTGKDPEQNIMTKLSKKFVEIEDIGKGTEGWELRL